MTAIPGPQANRDRASDYLESSFRAKLLEHVFISELLQEAWLGRGETAEVLRSEVDTSGYDLLLECRGILRHVQLKGSRANAKTSRQTVNTKLAEKPGGCVVWLIYEEADRRMKLQYLFYGGRPGQRPYLGDKIAKHTRANAQGYKAERPTIRVLSKSKFERVDSISGLFELLFE